VVNRQEVPIVLDAIFVALMIVFFAASIGYVAACERLMK
jgi:hypothetical protein